MGLRPSKPTALLAALLLLAALFAPGVHLLEHAWSAESERAAGTVHVCPLHPAPRGHRGDGRDRIEPGRIELRECSLGHLLVQQVRWVPTATAAPTGRLDVTRSEGLRLADGIRRIAQPRTKATARAPPTA